MTTIIMVKRCKICNERLYSDNEEHIKLCKNALIIQKTFRMYLCRKKIGNLTDGFTKDIVKQLLSSFQTNYTNIEALNETLKNRKIRYPNFPSEISENIVKFMIYNKYKIMPTWDVKNGDLELLNKKIEVKAFNSSGPLSFGPKEDWWRLYVLDCRSFKDKNFICYEISLSNKDTLWKNIKVSKTQTFADQCKTKRRPRICFNLLIKQIPTKYVNKLVMKL